MGQPAFLYPTYAASSVTVTASGTKAGTAPGNVVEAVEDTCWQPASTSGTQTLTFDFGTQKEFSACVIVGEALAGVGIVVEASGDGSTWFSSSSAYDDLVADTGRNIHTDPLCANAAAWELSSLATVTTNIELEMTAPPPVEGPTTAIYPASAPFVSCLPGDTFAAYARVTIPSAFYSDDGTGLNTVGLYIRFYNSGGSLLSASLAGPANLATRDTGQIIGGLVTAPANAVSYRVVAYVSHSYDAVGTVTFDDFFLGVAGDLPSVTGGGTVSFAIQNEITRMESPAGFVRYRRLSFTNLGASSKINHVLFCDLAAGTLPYFTSDYDADAMEVEAKAITSTQGYFLGTTHSRSMRPFSCDFGLLSSAEAATLRAWADACVKTPRAFAFVPDVDLSLTYFVWQEKPMFRMPQVSSGLYRPDTIELISRINHAD